MRRILVLLLVCAAAAPAQSNLARPRAGYLTDDSHVLRPVWGVAANFTLGEPVVDGVLSAASSGRSLLVKTAGELLIFDGEGALLSRCRAPGGEAKFAFDAAGSPGLAFFPETSELARVAGGRLETIAIDARVMAGAVLAVAWPQAGSVLVAVRREQGIWLVRLSLETGLVEDERLLAGVAGGVHLLGDGTVLYGDAGDLVLRKPDASEQRIPFAAQACGFAEMGEGWVLVLARDGETGRVIRFALRLPADRGELFQLPEVSR